MATVAGATQPEKTFSLEGLTYKQAANKVYRNLAAWDDGFSALKTALEKTPTEIQDIALQHIANKDTSALTSLLNKSYEYYRIVLEEQEAALNVLHTLESQFAKTIRYCTPLNVSLHPEQLIDLTKHGFDMRSYPQKEVELAATSTALLREASKIQAAIKNIQLFITKCPQAMNCAARAVKQATRTKTWGDSLPEKLVGETRYFMEGYEAFQKQNPKIHTTTSEQTTTASSKATETSPTFVAPDALAMLTKIIDEEQNK